MATRCAGRTVSGRARPPRRPGRAGTVSRARQPALPDRLPLVRRRSTSTSSPGVSAFVGPNGQGKTNLVEAIGYVATLSSHRVSTDAALVRAGAPRAVVRVRAVRGDRQTLVELEINPGRANRAQVNRAPVRRPRDVLGILRTVRLRPGGPRPRQGRPRRATPVPRRAHRAGLAADGRGAGRLRPGAAPARRAAQDGRARDAASGAVPRCRRDPGDGDGGRGRPAHARRVGRQARADRRRRSSRRGSASSSSSARTSRSRTPQVSDGRRGDARLPLVAAPSRDGGRRRRGRRRRPGRRPTSCPRSRTPASGADVLEAQLLEAMAGCAGRRSSAASTSSGRTATTWSSGSAGSRPRGTRATASRGRSRSPCGSRRYQLLTHGDDGDDRVPAGRRAPSRCSCSTTCSPSSTSGAADRLARARRRRGAGARHGGRAAGRPRASWSARGIDVMGGQVNRVR